MAQGTRYGDSKELGDLEGVPKVWVVFPPLVVDLSALILEDILELNVGGCIGTRASEAGENIKDLLFGGFFDDSGAASLIAGCKPKRDSWRSVRKASSRVPLEERLAGTLGPILVLLREMALIRATDAPIKAKPTMICATLANE